MSTMYSNKVSAVFSVAHRPTLPIHWATALVEDSDNRSESAFDDEEDGEGKLAEQGSLNWVGRDRKLCGTPRDAVKDGIQFGEETRDQGRIARVVPVNASSMSSCARG